MKIFTKVVWEWQGDVLAVVESESFDYHGPVALAGGGDDSNQYYENLNRLYGIQADQAQELMGIARETVFPAYSRFLSQSMDYGSEANKNRAAANAAADSRAATTAAAKGMEEQVVSMGINPADDQLQKNLRGLNVMGAAQEAGASTGARERVDREGFARAQDAISMGMGTPTQATAAANSAANSANAAGNMYWQGQQQQQNSIAAMTRAGLGMWNGDGVGFGSEGGSVRGLPRYKDGGYVRHMAMGGFMSPVNAPPPPAMRGPRPSPYQSLGQAAGMPAARTAIAKGIEGAGNLTGSPGVSAFGRGLQLTPGQANTAAGAYREAATRMVDSALGARGPTPPGLDTAGMGSAEIGAASTDLAMTQTPVALDTAGLGAAEIGTIAADAAAAETAATAAAGTTAAELGAAGTGLAAAGTVGAAIPVIGAGLAVYGIGNAMGWWADGGSVQPGSMGDTGEVDGPGGPKDDMVPAMLSKDEFVMPVGAVRYFGLDRLEKMRQKGLEYEQQMGIGRK